MSSAISEVLAEVAWTERHRERLRRIFRPATVHFLRGKDSRFQELVNRCQVAVIGGPADDRFLAARDLRWIHCDQAGLDAFAPRRLIESPIAVTSAAGRSAPVLAEHAIFFMLCLCYDVKRLQRAQTFRIWGIKGQRQQRGLHGRRICIVGLGATGTELARQCRAFGMHVTAFRRRQLPPPVPEVRVLSRDNGDQLSDAMAQAEFVALCASLNDQSYQMVGAKELACMEPGSYLINVARARLVDGRAMIAALKSGQLAGAGVDVVDPHEPLPPWHRLWSVPNLIITPHVTPQLANRTDRSLDIIERNRTLFLAGEPMLNRLQEDDIFSQPKRVRARIARRTYNALNRLRGV